MENSIESLNSLNLQELKTLYVSRPVALADAEKIVQWALSQGIKNVIDPLDIHVTTAYSSTEVDWNQLQPDASALTVEAGELSVAALGEDGAIVLQVKNKQLCDRWRQFQDSGASWDFQSHTPHITVTDHGGKVDLAGIIAYPESFVLHGEEWDTLRLDWAPEISQQYEPTIQDLFITAKELKDFIQLKNGMIEIIDRDMRSLALRRELEVDALEETINKLAGIKIQLNEKITKEDWSDLNFNKASIVLAGKKVVKSTQSWMQVFVKNLKSMGGR
jgi:hypothetical protein